MARAVTLGLAIAVLAAPIASPAFGEASSHCSGFASAPSLPDGSSASHGSMATSGRAVEAWRQEREVKMAACRADIEALRVELNAMEQAYNQAGAERNSVLGAWNGEVTEYAERRRPSRRD